MTSPEEFCQGWASSPSGKAALPVAYLFLTRGLPEPQLRLGTRSVFVRSDVQRVARK
jgi:hypothetical protein